VTASVRYQNNLSDRILNPRLEVRLSGAALDKLSVKPGGNGVYDQTTGMVVWNLEDNLDSKQLNPGASGRVTVEFASLSSEILSQSGNEINLNFLLTGTPVSGLGMGPISVMETRTVRVSSQVNFSSRALRSLGPFSNSGFLPPQVDKQTTYTILFSIGNTRGDVSNARVTAQLGQGVTWLGAQTGENISYNSSNNQVIWNLGTLQSDSGFSSDVREGAFQIALTPTIGQVGTAPILVNGIIFSGNDASTGESVTANNPPLTTRLVSDPVFIQGDDIVQK
jgi:hypothetical protein